jgi:deoxycytidylate deaminase
MKSIHKYDTNIMDIAHDVAMKSDMRNKHGCVITDYRRTIIAVECNKTINISKKTLHSMEFNKKNKISRHAEENALRNVDLSKLYGASLYVVRAGYHKNERIFMNSKPCERCTSIIHSCMRKFGLKVVYYSTDVSSDV